MRRKLLLALALGGAPLLFQACAGSQQEAANAPAAAATPPADKFYIGTEVRAEPQEGITPGKPIYPPAVSRKLSFSDKPLAVYEGQAVIRLPLNADKTAAKGRHTFRAKIRVQPCNDQACLPPREID